jgi:hypothetical protein
MVARAETRQAFDVTDGYEPCGDKVVDDSITEAIKLFYDGDETRPDLFPGLANGARAAYRQVDIKKRIADARWEWGKSKDAELTTRSIDLTTAQIVRALARVVLEGDPSQVEKKHIVPIEDYWKVVDDKVRTEIDEFTNRQDGVIIPYHMDFTTDSEYTFKPVSEVNDFRIYGRFLIRSGMYLQVDYLAQHASLPIDE